MARYALLLLPSANRVYAEAAAGLARAELELFGQAALAGGLGEIAETTIGGVGYVTFEAPSLDASAIALLSNLSAGYALFERADGLLRPVALHRLDCYDDDLITIQKYQGKTNEQFTKLLLNVTLLSSSFAAELLTRKLSVLDPLCGRGTTLNQALMYGFDAAGVDLDQKDFAAYRAFLQTWLQRKRLKHHVSYDGPVRRNGKVVARRLQVRWHPAGTPGRPAPPNCSTSSTPTRWRRRSSSGRAPSHVIVTDAPYGVQHGSRSATAGLARGPLELLRQAVPAWAGVLRPGGAIGIAWNTLVARREDAAAILAQAGLEPLTQPPYLSFRHRVDQAIVRDILVARKPA